MPSLLRHSLIARSRSSRIWRQFITVFVLLAFLGLANLFFWPHVSQVYAQDKKGQRSFDAKRLLHLFDFEEADDGNFEDKPRFWYAMGRSEQSSNRNFNSKPFNQKMMARKGFPNYTTVKFNQPQSKKGPHNLHLGLNGGSAGAFVEVGAIAAVPGSDYMVTARIKTSALEYARARLIVYFIDASGRRIESSMQASDLLNTANSWEQVTIKLFGNHTDAAWIGMQVELLQPQHQMDFERSVATSKSGKHSVRYQQVKGDAWFDDIAIWQVPRVVVQTQSPVNLIVSPQQPLLTLQVRDLIGQRMLAVTTVYNHRHEVVAKTSRYVGRGRTSQWQWQPGISRYGWYLVDLSLYESTGQKPAGLVGPNGQVTPVDGLTLSSPPQANAAPNKPVAPVALVNAGNTSSPAIPTTAVTQLTKPAGQPRGRSISDETDAKQKVVPITRTLRAFLLLPKREHMARHDKQRFTVDVHEATGRELSLLPAVLKAGGLRSVSVSGWRRNTTSANIHMQQNVLDQLLDPLNQLNVAIEVNLSPVPDEIVDRLGVNRHNPIWLFGQPIKNWEPFVKPMLMRQGQHVRRWQLGPSATATTALDDYLQSHADIATDTTSKYAPEPHVVLPWQLFQPRRKDFDDKNVSFELDVPASVQSQYLGTYLKPWQDGDAPFALHIHIPDATELSQVDRVDMLATRMIETWKYKPEGLTITRPWAVGDGTSQYNAIHPGPLFGVFATVSEKLAGRKVVGRFDVKKGVVAVIFDQVQPGKEPRMLAIWNDTASNDETDVELFLGEDPVTTDVWGNRIPIRRVEDKHLLTISRTPLFIEGIDANLALCRSKFKVSPRLVQASQADAEHKLSLSNPWKRTITGVLEIKQPGHDWRIEPRTIRFTLEPGQTQDYSVHISAPIRTLAGDNKIVAEVRFAAEERYAIEMSAPIRVGMPDLEMDSGLTFEANAGTGEMDAIATVFLSNTGKKPRTFYYYAIAPGHPRQERVASSLPAGQTLIRRFRFKGAGQGDAAKLFKVRVGVRDVQGPASMSQLLKP